VVSLPHRVDLMSCAPAKGFAVLGATLGRGAPGDVTVFDPTLVWQVDPTSFLSKSRNTPFGGRKLRGRAVLTIVDGRAVHDALRRKESASS
jgi:dihydroorotase